MGLKLKKLDNRLFCVGFMSAMLSFGSFLWYAVAATNPSPPSEGHVVTITLQGQGVKDEYLLGIGDQVRFDAQCTCGGTHDLKWKTNWKHLLDDIKEGGKGTEGHIWITGRVKNDLRLRRLSYNIVAVCNQARAECKTKFNVFIRISPKKVVINYGVPKFGSVTPDPATRAVLDRLAEIGEALEKIQEDNIVDPDETIVLENILAEQETLRSALKNTKFIVTGPELPPTPSPVSIVVTGTPGQRFKIKKKFDPKNIIDVSVPKVDKLPEAGGVVVVITPRNRLGLAQIEAALVRFPDVKARATIHVAGMDKDKAIKKAEEIFEEEEEERSNYITTAGVVVPAVLAIIALVVSFPLQVALVIFAGVIAVALLIANRAWKRNNAANLRRNKAAARSQPKAP